MLLMTITKLTLSNRAFKITFASWLVIVVGQFKQLLANLVNVHFIPTLHSCTQYQT